jgi:hypothetical protein
MVTRNAGSSGFGMGSFFKLASARGLRFLNSGADSMLGQNNTGSPITGVWARTASLNRSYVFRVGKFPVGSVSVGSGFGTMTEPDGKVSPSTKAVSSEVKPPAVPASFPKRDARPPRLRGLAGNSCPACVTAGNTVPEARRGEGTRGTMSGGAVTRPDGIADCGGDPIHGVTLVVDGRLPAISPPNRT